MRFSASLLFLFSLMWLPTGYALDAQAIRAKLSAALPGLPVSSITKSAAPGYYEVQVGEATVYASEDGEYLFVGDLMAVKPDGLVNLTEEARQVRRKELLAAQSEQSMVVFSPPADQVKATITVFTDIDCGYCRKLHQEMPELNRLGIAVRYVAYPRAGIGSASYNKIVSAWCADDPHTALTRAKAGKKIEQQTCPNPVAEHFDLGGRIGVTGTPAIIYENGYLQAGYAPAQDMARNLGILD